jgi:hypothetical protein
MKADFLGTGITSNNNQSNSYVLRQRVLYAEAEDQQRLDLAGGQMWSLATEGKKGISSYPATCRLRRPSTRTTLPGFVWTRQYGFRVTKSFNKAAFGISLENPQLLYTASLAGNTPYACSAAPGRTAATTTPPSAPARPRPRS